MALFPFCVIGDVQKRNPHRDTYGSGTKPTDVQVKEFMDDYAAKLRAICAEVGYDVDNLHEVKGHVALAVTAGSDKEVAVASGEGEAFAVGDLLWLCGLKDGIRYWEFDTLKAKSGDSLTITTVDNPYDADTLDVYVINDALQILRDLNSLGAAHEAEKVAFMGSAPNRSDHAEALWEQYQGDEDNPRGVWAIQNLPGYLRGATVSESGVVRIGLQSYGSEHPTDDDVQPVITRDMDF